MTCGGNDGAVSQVGLYTARDHGLIAVSCSRDGTLKVRAMEGEKLGTGGRGQGWNSQFCFWSQRIYNGGRICYISYVFMVPY